MMLTRQQRFLDSTRYFNRNLSAIVAKLLAVFLPLAFSSPLLSEPVLPRSLSERPNSQSLYPDTNTGAVSVGKSMIEGETCNNSDTPSQQLTSFVNSWVKAAKWFEKPETGLDLLIQKFGPQMMAYLAPSSWPNINEQARLARVPVIMYHDILPKKEVFFDVTPDEFEQHLQLIQKNGVTPISLNQLVTHLKTGLPLPEKPILLTFDDGYGSHYKYVYPLLKKYNYPGVFSIYTLNVGKNTGRSHVTWNQLREMATDPLVTISAHSVTHPQDVTALPDDKLRMEVVESKRIIENMLGIHIGYFTYPEGKYDARVEKFVQAAGYEAALTMNDLENRFAGQSKNLLAIERIGQSRLEYALLRAWGGPKQLYSRGFDFTAPVELNKTKIDKIPLILITGGRPITIHAKSRYQVPQIVADTKAIAAVDGGFFSLHFLNSNEMIGPVLSQNENRFIPGQKGEILKLSGRPLVLINSQAVQFIPFNPNKHNTLPNIQAEMPNVTDAFVAAAWLVKNGQPQPPSSFGTLFKFNEPRYRAFWGINQAGKPTIGVSTKSVGSVALGTALAKAGFRDAVMVDSGASTSLDYKGESLVSYVPRPVPHVVALVAPDSVVVRNAACPKVGY